jgi:hypothetical protein
VRDPRGDAVEQVIERTARLDELGAAGTAAR